MSSNSKPIAEKKEPVVNVKPTPKKKPVVIAKPTSKDIPVSKSTQKIKNPAPSNTPRTTSSSSSPKSAFLSKPKVLYIADSVGHTASMQNLEFFQGCRIKTARAYSSILDNEAKWPKHNFADVAKHALKKPGRDQVDVLVMSAPTVDISNLDTTKVQQMDKTDIFQQKATLSSKNMFTIAETTLKQNSSITKVIIMEHPPRFDTFDVDPTSLKANLARIANAALGLLWLSSPLKDKIFIGRHSLENSGTGAVHSARYQNQYTGHYDGVHLYGPTG